MKQNIFKCPICRFPYKTKEEAINCTQKYGIPQKPKLKKWQKVIINNDFFKNQKAIVIACGYTTQNCISRKPHTMLYIVKFQDETKTTAIEEELTPYEQ